MPSPSLDVVRQVLSTDDRGIAIFRAVNDAWGQFQIRYPDRAWWRRRSTRAALVWEHAVQNLIGTIGTSSGVHVESHNDTVSFILDQLVLLRFKKASLELRSSNVSTGLSELFHFHAADLYGYNDLHRVEAVYVLNRLETAPLWIGIVARNKRRQLWSLDLDPQAEVVYQLPLTAKTGEAADRVVKFKKPATKKKIRQEE